MTVQSVPLEPGSTYCTVDDVSNYLRGRSFTADSTPSISQIEALIADATEEIDSMTNRAWRERQVVDNTSPVKFHHEQLSHHRRRRYRRALTGGTRMDRRAVSFLPTPHIRTIDPAEGDKIEVLLNRSTVDITEGEGRDSDFVLDYDTGILRPRLTLFTGGTPFGRVRFGGSIDTDAKIRTTYRYGRDTDVPRDITRACAKLVIADLIRGDLWSTVTPGGDSDSNAETTALDYEESAQNTLRAYRFSPRR